MNFYVGWKVLIKIMTYKELIPNNVWLFEHMLDEESLSYLDREYVNKEFDMIHVNNKDFKPLMADTDMSYRVITMEIFKPIYDKLNVLTCNEFGVSLAYEKTSGLNMQYKRFEGNDFYALHAEDKSKYGDLVYILYLTNEIDGNLVLPSFEDAQPQWSDGFQEMTEQFEVGFSPTTVDIIPKRNRCIVMRTGIAHYVNPCSGRRDSIAGWPWFKKI